MPRGALPQSIGVTNHLDQSPRLPTMRITSVLATSLALAPTLLAQRFPEVEPNGTAATAQPITVGSQIDCTLLAADADWFSFTLPSATRIRIHTSGNISTGTPSGADTRIALCDSTGTVYYGPKGNVVFNAATCWWADGLSAPPGYVRPSVYTSPKGPNERVQKMTANVLQRFLKK